MGLSALFARIYHEAAPPRGAVPEDQDEVGVYMTDPEFRLKYCQHANDISHFNADGMKRILPMFEKRFSEILEK